MPLLLLAPRDDPDRSRLAAALAHLRARWPGTFLLVACEGPPPALAPAEDLDWVSLPAGATADELAALREALIRAYGVDALLDLGTQEPLEAQLARLASTLPFEATARPGLDGDGGRSLLARLQAHLKRGGKPRCLLRWLGPMGTEVVELAEKMAETCRASVEVRLPLSAQKGVWRRPEAWRAGLRALQGTGRGVRYRLISASQAAWVGASLSALNRVLRLASRGAP
jgi:hypothetical protein